MDLLIINFHTLEGDTLQDKRKSFNRLLNRIEQELTTDEELNIFAAALIPKSRLEDIFKVEILLRFQRNDALLDVLKSGDVILIRKVLNYWRFFEIGFGNIDAETLVDDFFPRTSFSTRTKVITRLAANLKSDVLADSYFEAIEKKYGLKIASAILPACSLNLVKSTVKRFKVKLCARQLLKIFRKHHEFLDYFFDVHYKDEDRKNLSPEYDKVVKHVAKVDEELFWSLCEKYEVNTKFGRHMTSYVYSSKYKAENFNAKRIYATIKEDEGKIRDFVMTLCPRDVDDFYFEFVSSYKTLQQIIKCFPKDKRYAVINESFREKYGKSLWEHYEDRMPEVVLDIIPVEEHKVIVDRKIFNDESFMYMWPAHVAVPLLEERINYTSDQNERCELVVQLFKSCSFNDDVEALVGVLNYVRNKFRNDNYITTVFIIQLFDWTQQNKLREVHWSQIVKIVKPLADDSRIYWHPMAAYFKYKVKNSDSPRDDFNKLFIKTMADAKSSFFWSSSYEELDRQCIEQMALLIPEMFGDNEYQNAAVWLLSGMVHHNKRNPTKKILLSNYPDFVRVAKASLAKEDCGDEVTILKYCVRFEHDRDEDYDHLFWQHYEEMHDGDVLLWYLRRKPSAVFQNIDKVLKRASPRITSKQLRSMFKIISMCAPSGAVQKIVSRAVDSLKANDIYSAEFSLIALSHLAEGKYLEATEQYYPPEDGKIDYENLDKNRLTVQESVARSLVNLQRPSASLHPLVKFCKGDYLKHTYGSLFNVTARTPEVDLPKFFDALSNSGVSVRKHVVCLITSLSAKKTAYNFLKHAGESDEHPTLRKAVFKNTLRYFVANQDEDFWDLLQSDVGIIDADDTEAHEHLTCLGKIPHNYLPPYIEMVYEILAGHRSEQIQNKKWDLLKGIPESAFQNLGDEFLKKGITETLFAQNRSEFWLNCVFCTAGQKQREMLLFSLGLFKNYCERNFPQPTGNFSKEALRNVHFFVFGFCERCIIANADETLIKEFTKFWSEMAVKKDFYEEQLQLQLTHGYLTCLSKEKMREFGVEANAFLSNWIGERHDDSVLYLFAEKLKTLLDSVTKREEELAEFLETFCYGSNVAYNYIVAMNLLSEHGNSSHFDGVVAKLRDCDIPSVRIRFGQFLKTSSTV